MTAQHLVKRFWERVERRGEDECWPWRLKPVSNGYCILNWREGGRVRQIRAHRLSWEIANGRNFPKGLVARHKCDNPGCVNPNHIIPGTVADNNRDTVERKRHSNIRKTHCVHGHPISGENLIIRKSGHRSCRICQNEGQRRWRERQS